MKRAILFKFHKDVRVCKNRLKLLKKFNPDVPIFGLYGGVENDFELFANKLGELLDDIYCIRSKSATWKWKNGDLAVRMWFQDVGNKFNFDVLHIIEWDLVIFGSLDDVYKDIPQNALGLTSLFLAEEIKDDWIWLSENAQGVFKTDWKEFFNYIRREFDYNKPPFVCLMPGPVMPRLFLERYCNIHIPKRFQDNIHDELRVPLFAQALGFDLYDNKFTVGWLNDNDRRVFNCKKLLVWPPNILNGRLKMTGRRVFHPVTVVVPFDFKSTWQYIIVFSSWLKFHMSKIFREMKRIVIKLFSCIIKNIDKMNILKRQRHKFKKVYSQEGEDIIIERLFANSSGGYYVSVGAYHPVEYSNTYFLYKRGWRGINIDATPGSMKLFNKFRGEDVNVESLISNNNVTKIFYLFRESALNTISGKLARKYIEGGHQLIKRINLKPKRLGDILDEHLIVGQQIDLLNVDTEGSEIDVLESNDWNKYSPRVIILEIMNLDLSNPEQNVKYLFMVKRGYRIYAKLFYSVIFVKEGDDILKSR